MSSAWPLLVSVWASVGSASSSWLRDLAAEFYPAQYVTPRLAAGQKIVIDGVLDDAAWSEVNFTDTPFVDIAQPQFPNYRIPGHNYTRVKVRWDAHYLYVGALLGEAIPTGTVTGHNSYLTSTRPAYGVVPYFDNDFEVFVDPSMTNYFYKEFEMNYLNATYDVLWRAPSPGGLSIGVPCSQSSDTNWCENTTFGHDGTWTMYNRDYADSGMRSQTSRTPDGWSLEIAFPIQGDALHGGLIDAAPGVDVRSYDPNNGRKYWWVDFSRAEHPWFNYNFTDSELGKLSKLCAAIQKESPELLGTSKYSCYWEWTWQTVGGHAYMHNPDTFGFLQFASHLSEPKCDNIEWPTRFFLAQIYQAQVQYVLANHQYSSDLNELAKTAYCTIPRGCWPSVLKLLSMHEDEIAVEWQVDNTASSCVSYTTPVAPTGGPCFNLTLIHKTQVRDPAGQYIVVRASIRENRYMDVEPHPSGCLFDRERATSMRSDQIQRETTF